MNTTDGSESDRQLRFIQELIEENVSIDGDAVQLARNTWAIHGVIPVDGEVIIAEFATYDEARIVLDEISTQTSLPDQRSTTEPQ